MSKFGHSNGVSLRLAQDADVGDPKEDKWEGRMECMDITSATQKELLKKVFHC